MKKAQTRNSPTLKLVSLNTSHRHYEEEKALIPAFCDVVISRAFNQTKTLWNFVFHHFIHLLRSLHRKYECRDDSDIRVFLLNFVSYLAPDLAWGRRECSRG
ncbi:hypothetical protein JXI42_13900 [bacterium]|nr:hypothetical protein [bacterium]